MREIAWKANLGSLKGRSGIDMGEEILFFLLGGISSVQLKFPCSEVFIHRHSLGNYGFKGFN